MVKTRYDFELLKDYVEKTGVVLSKNYENEYLTRNIKIEGNCLGENCEISEKQLNNSFTPLKI
jgi:hypothetical protein